MIFSRKNAGKWVASKDSKVIAASVSLKGLWKKMGKRPDKDAIRYDKVPSGSFVGGCYGI